MSGRAVRKALQRQREQEFLKSTEPELSSESENDTPAPPRQSLFALLGGADDDGDDDDAVDQEEPIAPKSTPQVSTPKSKKKKKKKPKGGKSMEDDIDRALRQLKLEAPSPSLEAEKKTSALSGVLKVDTRNLDAANEMRRLFGRDALRADGDGGGQPGARRGGRGARIMPGAAPGGARGFTTGRRNPFVQPKEEWPKVGSGGLGMEVVSESEFEEEGITEFKFVHARAYQDVQRQFILCVLSGDPTRMINLLQHNPYHVSTLLQCSEIFHHQRDFTIAGDLLERALYSMGRSLHSSFPQKLAEGTARLSFRYPENRELWLCGWRYIKNLSQRGTWRTAEEFARLLLALNPIEDPYQICLIIDFLSLKARQPQRLLDLIEHPSLRNIYADLPNLAFSAALAHQQLGNDNAAQEYLAKAISKFPWIPSMLYQELSIDQTLPPALWGKQPPNLNPRQLVLAQSYVSYSKDLWKDPAAAALLTSTASAIYNLPRKDPLEGSLTTVPDNLARHIILIDIGLRGLIPRDAASREGSSSFDPLPPINNQRSYDDQPWHDDQPSMDTMDDGTLSPDANPFTTFIRSILPWFEPGVSEAQAERFQQLREQLARAGVDIEELVREGQEWEMRQQERGNVNDNDEQPEVQEEENLRRGD